MNQESNSKTEECRFRDEHATKYGLKVTQRNATNGDVISVRCQFCVYFGPENVETDKTRKRAKKDTKKTWTNKFRADLYQSHLKGEHKSIWASYQICSYDDKVNFFSQKDVLKNTLHEHFDTPTPIQYFFNIGIIEVLICDMFFHPDDHGGVTQTAVKKLFQKLSNQYQVLIPNPMQFRLVIAQITRGTSFRQVVGIIKDIKEITRTYNSLRC
jgi:hypothetical protein